MYDRSMSGSDLIPVLIGMLTCVLVAHLVTIGFAYYRLQPRSLRGNGYVRQKRWLIRIGVLAEHETADEGDVGELVGTWRRICAWATIGGSVGGLAAGILVAPLALVTPHDPTIYGSALELHWFLAFLLVGAAQGLGLTVGRGADFMATVRNIRPLSLRPGETHVLRLQDIRSPKLTLFVILEFLCFVGLTVLVVTLLASYALQHREHAAFIFPASVVLAAFPALTAFGLLAGELLTRRLMRQPVLALTPDNDLARHGFEHLRAYQLSAVARAPYMTLGLCAQFEAGALLQMGLFSFISAGAAWALYFALFGLFLVGFGLSMWPRMNFYAHLTGRIPPRQAAA